MRRSEGRAIERLTRGISEWMAFYCTRVKFACHKYCWSMIRASTCILFCEGRSERRNALEKSNTADMCLSAWRDRVKSKLREARKKRKKEMLFGCQVCPRMNSFRWQISAYVSGLDRGHEKKFNRFFGCAFFGRESMPFFELISPFPSNLPSYNFLSIFISFVAISYFYECDDELEIENGFVY